MRIMLMVSSMHAGGAERVAATLCNAWAARGDTVALVPTYSGKGACFYPLDTGVELIWLADRAGGTGALASLRRLYALRKLVQQWQPDVVVSFLTNVNVAGVLATCGLRVPIIVGERTHPVKNRLGKMLEWARRLTYRYADAVTVQSEAALAPLQTVAPGIRRVAVVPNPLPPALQQAAGYQVSPDGARKRLMAMGRLVADKQFDLLIDVFAEIAPAHPDWDLCIVGDGPERAALQRRIAQRDMTARITLSGRTHAPWETLAQGQAFVLSSRQEGFPNALLEAMALGLPCVAFDCPSGPREMTRDGQDALLVALSARGALAQALKRLLSDRALRLALGAQAARSVRQRYALDAVLGQWDALFAEVGALGPACAQHPSAPNVSFGRLPGNPRDGSGHPLKVLHVITGLGQGGAEAVLCRLIEASAAQVWHTVVSLSDEGVYGARLRAAGAAVHALGMKPGRLGWREWWRLRTVLRDSGCQVVQTWMYHADLLGGLAARSLGLRALAWGIRNSGEQLQHASRSARWALRLCALLSRRVPAAIVCCAQAARQRHVAAGYAPERMVVVHNGYDLSRYRPDPGARARLRQAWGCAPETPLIGCVARWHPLKDHANLLHALVRLRETLPALRCVLVGPGMTWDNAELAALVDSLGVRERLVLLGARDDVAAIMSALDVHVLPSRAEGFPNVLAEAMACGTPCVATDVGDATEIVGDQGWVVAAQNPQALAGGVAAALTALAAQGPALALACRTRVQRQFSLSAMVDAYVALWQRLAGYAARPKRPKLLFVVNNPAFFLSHRLPLAQAARDAGYAVHVATMAGPSVPEIVTHGLTHHVVPMSRSGRHPCQELGALWALWRLMRRVRPDVVHLVTIKPVLYGGLAARLAGVPGIVAAIAGLGFVYTRDRRVDPLRAVVTALYRIALGAANSRVIFQNATDCELLTSAGAVRAEQCVLIRGSGVDLSVYRPRPEPPGPITVCMAARLLRDKGVDEFIEAARLLRARGLPIRFRLAGSIDPGNPASVSQAETLRWQQEGVVTLLGEHRDIAQLYSESHIVVLPSYREGLPRSLVEAAACARAVVTTDVPGCRDAIEPGVTGLLVPARDALALANAVAKLAEDAALRARMGAAGRALAEQAFDIRNIAMQHLDIYQRLLHRA